MNNYNLHNLNYNNLSYLFSSYYCKDRIKFNKESYEKYRKLGLILLDKIRNIPLHNISQQTEYCTIFIDNRKDSFFEFIIRMILIQLNNEWMHYVICTNNNFEFMKNMCNKISKNIIVIQLDSQYKLNSVNSYSDLLKTEYFWNLFNSKKALIYQSDTFIFDSTLLSQFMIYDYIGAPWIHTPYNLVVGNGGLSLRNISVMKEIIQYHLHLLNNSNKNSNIDNIDSLPEDVFFGYYLKKLQKKIPNILTAAKFSLENICFIENQTYFGGHQFWFCLSNWKELVENNITKLIVMNSNKIKL